MCKSGQYVNGKINICKDNSELKELKVMKMFAEIIWRGS